MKLFVPRERRPGERRVAATPETTRQLVKLGFEVAIETQAGMLASFSDEEYRSAGAAVVSEPQQSWSDADLVLKVQPPDEYSGVGAHEADLLREGATLVCFLWPGKNQGLVARLAARNVTAIAIDQIPRTTRAQKMDALSSMANIAGYRAVIEAASFYGRFFTGQMTAAGRVPPAKVLVIGAGVAGLAALGADLAAENGGNCELTVPGSVVERDGVHIIGYIDLPSRLAPTASLLYGNNLVHLLTDMGGAERFRIDPDDPVVRSALIVHNGAIVWPPPRLEAPASAVKPVAQPSAATKKPVAKESSHATRILALAIAAAAAVALGLTPVEVAQHLLDARRVIIVPGYGMAVAQSQYPLYDMTELLRARGIDVKFAIHPVAGRLPGHMNVLLAEARVPYDIVDEMEEANVDLPETDVAIVIGANDIVKPGALDDPSNPIYGMPIIEVWKAKTCIVLKRGMASGYAGVENPLFYKDNTHMLFGDARKMVEAVLAELRQLTISKSA